MVSGPIDALEKEAAKLIASIESKKAKKRDCSYTQNRELSWLQFDRRVLEEALDPNVPVLERLKFVSIFCTNLDEFFMVRVGSITDLSIIAPDITENKANMTPSEQLDAIFAAVKPLVKERDEILASVTKELEKHGIVELDLASASKKERRFARDYYRDFIRPVLSPQVVDERHPFPHLKNKELYIVTTLSEEDGSVHLGIVPVPENISPIIADPNNPLHFVRAEKLIAHYVHKIFDIYETSDPIIISVTRNADISFDEEKFSDDEGDYRLHVSRLLKKRNRLNPVRLEIEGKADKALVTPLLKRLKLTKKQAFVTEGPINLTWAFGLEKRLSPEQKAVLCYPPFTPRASKEFDLNRSIIEQVKERDRLLFYPYDSMDPFLRMLQEAAVDPSVLSIKITVYRLASDSRVAQALAEAAENGKEVTTLMELRARFDEANNIDWAGRLEEAGCKIIYGMENYKCHSKVCLITKQENGRVINITQIGTGNYNEKTAKLYTDLSLITADEAIGRDAVKFFQNLLIGNLKGNYEKLLVAPKGMKPVIMKLIDREIAKGVKGRITLKANSVTERDIIDKLAEASKAGVQVRMNIRGICCQLPGIKDKTENIYVRSIVGQFLEHSRIYVFGEGEDLEMFIGSADLMTRNLVHRVEVACPVQDPEIRASILLFLEKIFEDNTKARSLEPNGEYAFVDKAHDADVFAHAGKSCLHDWCIEHALQDEARDRLANDAAAQAALASQNLVLDLGVEASSKDEDPEFDETEAESEIAAKAEPEIVEEPKAEAEAQTELDLAAEPEAEPEAQTELELEEGSEAEESLDSLLAKAGAITESALNAVPESEIDAVIESLASHPDKEIEIEADAEIEVEAESEAETDAEPSVEERLVEDLEPVSEPAEDEAKDEAEDEAKDEAVAEAKSDEKSETESEDTAEPENAAEAEAEAEPESEDAAEAEAESKPEPEAAAEPEPVRASLVDLVFGDTSDEDRALEIAEREIEIGIPDQSEKSSQNTESALDFDSELSSKLDSLLMSMHKGQEETQLEAEAEAEPEAEQEPEPKQEAEQKAEQEAEAEAKPEAEQEAKQAVEPEAKQVAEDEAESEAKPEAKPEAEQEAETEKPEAAQEAEPEAKQEVEAEAKPEAEQEAAPEIEVIFVKPDAAQEEESQPKAESDAKLEAELGAVPEFEIVFEKSESSHGTSETVIVIETDSESEPKHDPEPTIAEIMAAAAAAAAEEKQDSAEKKLERERSFASGAPHIPPKSEETPSEQEKEAEKQEEKAEPKKKAGFFKRLFS